MQIKNINYTLIGALTSKPYAFKARSWELESIETIDLFDSLCSNVKIDVRGSTIMRILPINNKNINDNWISDKGRFAYDGFRKRRFVNPMIRNDRIFVECSWSQIWTEISSILGNINNKFNNFVIKTGNFIDLEHITLLRTFVTNIQNWISVIINTKQNYNSNLEFNYLLNNKLFKDNGAKVILFVGTNLKVENPLINLKFNKLNKKKHILIASIGSSFNQNLNVLHISNNISSLKSILEGKHPFCRIIQNFLKKNLKNKKIYNIFKNNVSFVFGSELKININNYLSYINFTNNYITKFDYSNLKLFSGEINTSKLGFHNNFKITKSTRNIFYLLNVETAKEIKSNDYVIFQGHHNDKIYKKFNMILPTVSWLEKVSSYYNCLGVSQRSKFTIRPPTSNIKIDWKISKKLMECFNFSFFVLQHQNIKNYIDFENYLYNKNQFSIKREKFLNKYLLINNINNNNNVLDMHFNNVNNLHKNIDLILGNTLQFLNKNFCFQMLNFKNKKHLYFKDLTNVMPFKLYIFDYYQVTNIERVSKIMINCSNTLNKKYNNFLK